MQPDAGRVTIDDRDITHLAMHQRAHAGIGYLPQEASVFRKLTVEDNVLAILETRENLDDTAILAKIRAALSLDRQTKPLEIQVTVRDGRVVLEGFVPSEELRVRVLDRVEAVTGVVTVDDRLTKN